MTHPAPLRPVVVTAAARSSVAADRRSRGLSGCGRCGGAWGRVAAGGGVADVLVDELVSDVGGEVAAVLGGEGGERQVDAGGAAGTGGDASGTLEQGVAGGHVVVQLGEGGASAVPKGPCSPPPPAELRSAGLWDTVASTAQPQGNRL